MATADRRAKLKRVGMRRRGSGWRWDWAANLLTDASINGMSASAWAANLKRWRRRHR